MAAASTRAEQDRRQPSLPRALGSGALTAPAVQRVQSAGAQPPGCPRVSHVCPGPPAVFGLSTSTPSPSCGRRLDKAVSPGQTLGLLSPGPGSLWWPLSSRGSLLRCTGAPGAPGARLPPGAAGCSPVWAPPPGAADSPSRPAARGAVALFCCALCPFRPRPGSSPCPGFSCEGHVGLEP